MQHVRHDLVLVWIGCIIRRLKVRFIILLVEAAFAKDISPIQAYYNETAPRGGCTIAGYRLSSTYGFTRSRIPRLILRRYEHQLRSTVELRSISDVN